MVTFERLGIVMKPVEGQLGRSARFNPGAAVKDGVVHLLYRAVDHPIGGEKYRSCIGYAKVDLEGHVLYDSNEKVIYPTCPDEEFGCEDPRIIPFEGRYYVFYTAYDGKVARVAVAVTDDFQHYEKLGTIHHYTWDKDAFIFPERIGGKIAYIHRIDPDIQIDYFDTFTQLLAPESWSSYASRVQQQTIMKSQFPWEAKKIGGSAPPLRTEMGWLFIYHGVDQNLVYRSGAALLDLKNPSIVIARIPYPLLEPVEDYEKIGDVNNVVFPQGAYIQHGEVYLYYGAADKYIALAKINLAALLDELAKYPVA